MKAKIHQRLFNFFGQQTLVCNEFLQLPNKLFHSQGYIAKRKGKPDPTYCWSESKNTA